MAHVQRGEATYPEGRKVAVLFLVKDQGAIFHLAGGEEPDVFGPRELLWCLSRGVVVRYRRAAHWTHDIEVVGDQDFVGD